jgi:hypothetical protein
VSDQEINEGHYLELMDRLYMVSCIVEDHLYNHPLAEKEEKVRLLIEKAGLLLAEAYQEVGQLEFTEHLK